MAESSHMLGGGEPGLKIAIDFKNTNQFAIYIDEPWTVGPGLAAGIDERHIDVLLDHDYQFKEKLHSKNERIDIPEQLYPFDEQEAFTCEGDSSFLNDRIYKTNSFYECISDDGKTLGFLRVTAVYSTNAESILISNDVYALARLRYGLTTNQLFLGRIATNIYYFEKGNPRKIFYRGTAETNAVNYFALPKGVLDLYGVTKAVSTNNDIGFVLVRNSVGFFHYSPNEFAFVEFSFKKAKRAKQDQ
jgi:hypothetical protein